VLSQSLFLQRKQGYFHNWHDDEVYIIGLQ